MYEYENRKLRKYLGNDLYNTFKKYNCIIAGGSILSIFNNTEINDIDLYFRSANDMSDFLHNEMAGTWIIAHTKKAFLFKCDGVKIQTIYFKYFNSPEEIFETFDFTVCMAAFDFKSEEFVLHEDFLRHNVSKILKFNERTAYPIVSALRVAKYKNKGFSISKPEYIKILLTILSLKIDNYDDLKEQMGGMYGENYDSLLEPKAGEAFDISSIIENLGRLGETDYDYKLNACNTEISDFDSFVCGVYMNDMAKCNNKIGWVYGFSGGEEGRECILRDIHGEIIRLPERAKNNPNVKFSSMKILCHNNNWQYVVCA